MCAKTIMSLILASALMASAAAAKPPLRDTVIDDALLSIGLADEIRKTCPDISARMVRALRTINGLKDQAMALGYSEAEIDAYRKSEQSAQERYRRTRDRGRRGDDPDPGL